MNCRACLICILIFGSGNFATAQTFAMSDQSIPVSPLFVQKTSMPLPNTKFEPGKPRRTIGILMVLLGVSFQTAGVLKIKEGTDDEKEKDGYGKPITREWASK